MEKIFSINLSGIYLENTLIEFSKKQGKLIFMFFCGHPVFHIYRGRKWKIYLERTLNEI